MGRSPGAKGRVAAMIRAVADEAAQRIIDDFDRINAKCESPIEELLLAALYVASEDGVADLKFSAGNPRAEAYTDETSYVYLQAKVGQYRVDMLIHDASMPFELAHPRWMVIECDGHDFHERTKEQARRDRQRDRYMQSQGLKVLRFTGSEIWEDPGKCAEEIIEHLAANDTGSAR